MWRKRNKYNAVRSNGFGSKLESAVYEILLMKESAGLIKDIQQQMRVDLGDGIYWRVDFRYFDKSTLEYVWVEAKGIETERYRICLKLWTGGAPGDLKFTKARIKRQGL